MIFTPIIPTNLKGHINDIHLDKAKLIIEKSLLLTSTHNQINLDEVIKLLRTTNSYYSNRIESEGTHPINIYNAMNGNFDTNQKNKLLQQLSLVHIEVQKYIEGSINTTNNIFDIEYIKKIHTEFYAKSDMKKFLNISFNNIKATMIAGEFRKQDVQIGNHIPTPFNILEDSMNQWANIYNKSITNKPKEEQLIYILSSHHRFVYLHPFLDGNGRISRLFLDYLFFKIGIKGYGLWNIARGLARQSSKYKETLSSADMPRQGSIDGRGALSNKALDEYLSFMLDTSLDQVNYMYENLKMQTLSSRLSKFVVMSSNKQINNIIVEKYSDLLFDKLLIKGELKRSEVGKVIGKSDRTASRLIRQLLDNDLIKSKSHKSVISLKITPRFASFLFPELFPEY